MMHLPSCSGFVVSSSALINNSLSSSQQSQLNALLSSYSYVFAQHSDNLGRISVLAHHIDTGDHPPINPYYRLPSSKRDEVERQIEFMMRTGVVCPSRSRWASPVVLVDKPDGSERFCVY